jgi:hypothetical protein
MTPTFPFIYIAGVARSGTSWVGQVLNSSPDTVYRFQPFFAYEFKGRLHEDSTSEDFRQVFAEMREANTPFLTQADKIAAGDYPQFNKHKDPGVLVFKENRYQSLVPQAVRKVPELGMLAVVRNPCAVLNSWRKNAKEFPPGSDFLEEWRHGMCKNQGPEDCFGYYRWKQAAHQYLDLEVQFPNRVKVLCYEEAVRKPLEIFQQLFAFFGLPFDSQTRRFLEDSTSSRQHSDSYYAVYKDASVIGQWRKELEQKVADEIHADLAGTRLARFLQ